MSRLLEAVRNGNLRAVKKALDSGVDVHTENDIALLWGCIGGHLEIVKVLLNAGADVHAQNDEALKLASINGRHIQLVKLLLDAGADVHAEDDKPLKNAAQYGGSAEVVKLLLDAGADVHAEDDKPLKNAAQYGHLDVVKVLLEADADVHAGDDTSLILASRNGYLEIVRILLEKGANAQARNNYALKVAFDGDHLEIIEILREYGASDGQSERIAQAREQEEKNAHLRIAALDEVKNSKETSSENPFINAHCASSNSLYGDPLKDADDIVVFEIGGNKGDCYLKEELKLLQSDQYVRGVGEKAYKLPWSNIWITKTLKEFAERMEGYGPLQLQKSEDVVGYNSSNILWVLRNREYMKNAA